jgi:hypothetical protein
MDSHDVALPDPSEIAPHAIAFARMMFAHAAFEREVRSLVNANQPEETRFWRATRESMDGIREWDGKDNHLD